VLGAVIMVIILLVVLPVAFIIGGAIVAAILGQSLSAAKQRDFEGTELGDLS
jgi:flagellar basal body-associated protein FliL